MGKTKTCSRCGEAKPLDKFYKQVRGAQGRRGTQAGAFAFAIALLSAQAYFWIWF